MKASLVGSLAEVPSAEHNASLGFSLPLLLSMSFVPSGSLSQRDMVLSGRRKEGTDVV